MADRLTSQLVEVADVVGNLGKNIAAAQKDLNKDYLNSLKSTLKIAADTIGSTDGDEDARAAMISLIKALAPAKYQYTETTLEFSADFAETMQKSTTIGGGVSMKMIQVNAAMTKGYGHDYRASARITTVMHAMPDPQFSDKILQRAETIRSSNLQLPDATDLDKDLIKAHRDVWSALNGEAVSNEGG